MSSRGLYSTMKRKHVEVPSSDGECDHDPTEIPMDSGADGDGAGGAVNAGFDGADDVDSLAATTLSWGQSHLPSPMLPLLESGGSDDDDRSVSAVCDDGGDVVGIPDLDLPPGPLSEWMRVWHDASEEFVWVPTREYLYFAASDNGTHVDNGCVDGDDGDLGSDESGEIELGSDDIAADCDGDDTPGPLAGDSCD